MSLQLTGIIPPLVTPFVPRSEDLDEAALRAEIGYLLQTGVHGLTLCGSTGEGQSLSIEESVRCAEIAVDEARGRVPVVVGIIRDSTREVIRYGRALRDVRGVDALQITPVHYLFDPGPAGTYAYYQQIGAAVGLPIVIYNVVPWNPISPETLLWLSEIPEVIAVKQSGGDIHKLAELLRSNRGRLQVLTAVDDLLYPSFLLGADGAIAARSPRVGRAGLAPSNHRRRRHPGLSWGREGAMTTEEQVARLTQIVCHLVQVLDGSHTGHPAATDEHGRLDLQQLCAELNELARIQQAPR